MAMTNTATTYFTHEDYIASRAARDAHLKEADGDTSRAIRAACIDMAALKAYVEEIEPLAIQLGAHIEDISTARPVPLDAPQRIAPNLSTALNRARHDTTY